jgi:hypothetical protein
MDSDIVSKQGNKYAQVFANQFGWTRVHPMAAKKSNAHDGLSLLFAHNGVHNCLIMDNSKEQTLGQFGAKAREADCWIKQTKAYLPWSNFAELAIQELKKGCTRKLIGAKVPKRLWDECLEMESYICSNTYNGHTSLKGETPETVMSGETADISEFAEHAFYDWIKFRDTTVAFPRSKLVLGRYLGPSTDIGPAMTAKILKQTGHVVHRSTFRALADNEMQDPAETQLRAEFDIDINRIFGDVSLAEDSSVDFTAEEVHDLYRDNSQEDNGVPDRDNLPDNHYNQYVNAEVLLMKGDSMVTGKVKRRKLDSLGIPTGRRHDNPSWTQEHTMSSSPTVLKWNTPPI